MMFFAHRDYAYDAEYLAVQPISGVSTTFITTSNDTLFTVFDPTLQDDVTVQLSDEKITAYCTNSKTLNRKGVWNIQFTDSPRFCFRNEDESEEFDDKLFYQDIKFEEYIDTSVCSAEDEQDDFDSWLNETKSEEYFEIAPPDFDDFRTIDPEKWKAMGGKGVPFRPGQPGYPVKKDLSDESLSLYHKPFPPGFYFPGEDKMDFSTEDVESNENGTEEGRVKRNTPPEVFKVQLDECEELPEPPRSCDYHIDKEKACVLLNHVLTIESIDWKDPLLRKGAWRLPIIDKINTIFTKICPQVTNIMPAAVGRLIELFLSRIKDNEKLQKPRNSKWKDVEVDLDRCVQAAKPMEFRRAKNVKAETRRKEIEKIILESGSNITVGLRKEVWW